MDKHSDNNRISIMINGKEKSVDLDEPSDVIKEQAATVEGEEQQDEDEFPWVLPNDHNENESEDNVSNVIDFEEKRYRKKQMKIPFRNGAAKITKRKNHPFRKKSFPKGLIALISAILIGLFFGVVVLSLFTKSSLLQPVNQATTSVKATEVINKQSPPATVANAVSIPPLSLYVIQGGAFSTKESAQNIANNITNSGFPSLVMDKSNPILLFMGIGPEKEIVEKMGQVYTNRGQEIYVKRYTVEGKTIHSANDKEITFMAQGRELYQSMLAGSAKLLSYQTVTKEEWANIQKQYHEWQQLKPANLSMNAQEFSKAITSSYQSFQSYEKDQKEQLLWDGQQSLLNSLSAYDQWLYKQK